jgi:hypothetical protein
MTASFLEQMLTIYTHLGMLSRGKFSLSLRGRGQGEGVPLIRLDAETHLATFSHKGGRRKTAFPEDIKFAHGAPTNSRP